MADPINLSNSLSYVAAFDKDLIAKWNTVIPILKNHIFSYEEVSPIYAAKYRFDAYSLFKECFNIAPNFIYPTMRVNGMDSITDYDGKVLRFYRLDPATLSTYYNKFIS